jgi:hypothetical protein
LIDKGPALFLSPFCFQDAELKAGLLQLSQTTRTNIAIGFSEQQIRRSLILEWLYATSIPALGCQSLYF